MTDHIRGESDDNQAFFVYNTVPAIKRDMIYNFTLVLNLPKQTLGMVEALVASELADFTIYDQQLNRELDPRQPTQYETINIIQNLAELSRDIQRSLDTKLRPIYRDMLRNKAEFNEEMLDERLQIAQCSLNLYNTTTNRYKATQADG